MLRLIVPLVLLSAPASAHGLGSVGFAAGLAHPLFGLDHLLAMVAVGLWAGRIGGQARWLVPLAFLTAMLLGSLLALELPLVETGIVGSVVILGLLVAVAPKLPLWVPTLVVGLFAVLHGHAHGTELSGGAATIGFLLATAALHGLGLALPYTRWLGLGVAMAGVALAVS
jgi:urease accessory protein